MRYLFKIMIFILYNSQVIDDTFLQPILECIHRD